MFKHGLDNVRLIDTISINERTIVSWFDLYDKDFSFAIYHLTDQPNTLSKLMPYCMWGYMTYVAPPIADPGEASEVYSLYLKDLIANKNWWEDDSHFVISDETKALLKKEIDKTVDLYRESMDTDEVEVIKPTLTLVE